MKSFMEILEKLHFRPSRNKIYNPSNLGSHNYNIRLKRNRTPNQETIIAIEKARKSIKNRKTSYGYSNIGDLLNDLDN